MKAHRVLVVVAVLLMAFPLAAQIREEVGDAPDVPVPEMVPNAPVWSPPRAVYWDNGPLVTHAGAGAGGADESRVQNNSLGMTTLGFANQGSYGRRMADDFTVSAGESWHIDTITFFSYQTGSPTTSTFTAANLQIWDGRPGDAGSSVVWGDLSTNRMADTSWTNIYRTAESSTGGTLRPIMAIVVDVGADFSAGTCWVDFMPYGSTSYSGPFTPPVTVLGETTTGNARQYFNDAWMDALDGGTSAPQGLPFIVEGGPSRAGIPTVSGTGIAVMALALIGVAVLLIRRRL